MLQRKTMWRTALISACWLGITACNNSNGGGGSAREAGSPATEGGTTSPQPEGGTTSPQPDAQPEGGAATPDGSRADGRASGGDCVRATRLFFEDFESGSYDNWSSRTYFNDWGPESGDCRENGFSTDRAVSGSGSHRSEITCESHDNVHRGYGGVQFSGDEVVENYTNEGVGLDAPHGVVISYSHWLDVPYQFGGGRWFSPFTAQSSCSYGERVITLGLDNPEGQMRPAHVRETGGTLEFLPTAQPFPLRAWVRTTIYLNYHDGVLHVWQDGQGLVRGTFSRPSNTLCHLHWGAYASGDNDQLELYEDDISVWKLEEAWTNFDREPFLGDDVPVCR